jgi:aspartate racemase
VTILGIIGGIAPESTVAYYRQIVALYRERTNDGSYPKIIINSIDLTSMLKLVATDLDGLTELLLQEIQRVADAGAGIALFASNTPHIVFDRLSARSPLPLISIVDTALREAQRFGVKKAGLLGTKFTMLGRFYSDTFARCGIEIVVPPAAAMEWVHNTYMTELVNGIFRPETKAKFIEVIATLRDGEGADAVILGGTELPLILTDTGDVFVQLIDTTKTHVEAAVALIAKPGGTPFASTEE